jgi:hypothetical protein
MLMIVIQLVVKLEVLGFPTTQEEEVVEEEEEEREKGHVISYKSRYDLVNAVDNG